MRVLSALIASFVALACGGAKSAPAAGPAAEVSSTKVSSAAARFTSAETETLAPETISSEGALDGQCANPGDEKCTQSQVPLCCNTSGGYKCTLIAAGW